jgi:hypothetical protein
MPPKLFDLSQQIDSQYQSLSIELNQLMTGKLYDDQPISAACDTDALRQKQ